jgi:hypothetical protein
MFLNMKHDSYITFLSYLSNVNFILCHVTLAVWDIDEIKGITFILLDFFLYNAYYWTMIVSWGQKHGKESLRQPVQSYSCGENLHFPLCISCVVLQEYKIEFVVPFPICTKNLNYNFMYDTQAHIDTSTQSVQFSHRKLGKQLELMRIFQIKL